MAFSDDRVITINRANRMAMLLIAAVAACATHPRAGDETSTAGKYPRRRPGCHLEIFYTPAPRGIAAWDDLGVAQVGCQIDTPQPQCLRRLMEEACRMGGDILYNVPEKPLRPSDQVLMYRAQVAHTLVKDGKPDEGPPPIEPDAGPVEPLVPKAIPTADAGAGG